jgi:hypothetical protein
MYLKKQPVSQDNDFKMLLITLKKQGNALSSVRSLTDSIKPKQFSHMILFDQRWSRKRQNVEDLKIFRLKKKKESQSNTDWMGLLEKNPIQTNDHPIERLENDQIIPELGMVVFDPIVHRIQKNALLLQRSLSVVK